MQTVFLGLYEKAMPEELTWEEKLLSAQTAGFDHLEISIDESEARLCRLWDRHKQTEIRHAMLDSGFPIRTMCLSAHRKYPMGSANVATRQQSVDILRRAVELAVELGIRIIQIAGYDVYYEPSTSQSVVYFMQGLETAAALAAQYGVVLGFETMETPFMDTVQKAMRYVTQIQSPYLQVFPDVGNLSNAALLYGEAPTTDLERGRGHIVAVHIKETAPGIYRDMRFGEGHVDFQACIQKALDLGARLFTAEFWHTNERDWKRELEHTSRFLKSYFIIN